MKIARCRRTGQLAAKKILSVSSSALVLVQTKDLGRSEHKESEPDLKLEAERTVVGQYDRGFLCCRLRRISQATLSWTLQNRTS